MDKETEMVFPSCVQSKLHSKNTLELRLGKGAQDAPAVLRAVGPPLDGGGTLGGVGFHGPCSLFLSYSSPSVSNLLEMRVESESCPLPGPPRPHCPCSLHFQTPVFSGPSPASPSHGYGSRFKGNGFPAPSAPWRTQPVWNMCSLWPLGHQTKQAHRPIHYMFLP